MLGKMKKTMMVRRSVPSSDRIRPFGHLMLLMLIHLLSSVSSVGFRSAMRCVRFLCILAFVFDIPIFMGSSGRVRLINNDTISE